jgi:hypothetical protein
MENLFIESILYAHKHPYLRFGSKKTRRVLGYGGRADDEKADEWT